MRNFKKIILGFATVALLSTAFAGNEPYTLKADEVDLDGTYQARVGIQGTSEDGIEWIQRIGYYSGDNMDDDPSVLATDNDEKGTYEIIDAPCTIDGNGTYSVALTFNEEVPISIIKQLQVATDIPINDTIKFTNFSCSVNGNTLITYDEAYIDTDAYCDDKMCLLVWNDWRNDLKQISSFPVDNKPTEVGTTYVLNFTVSGFNKNAEVTIEDTTIDLSSAETFTVDYKPVKKTSKVVKMLPYIVIGVVVIICIILIIIIIKMPSEKK